MSLTKFPLLFAQINFHTRAFENREPLTVPPLLKLSLTVLFVVVVVFQDTMDLFFSGKMASDRGSLYHAKNIFGHHSVKANVSECFNHISDLIKQITDAYTILLAMTILNLRSVDDFPVDDVSTFTKEQKRDFLADLSSKIVDAVWQDMDVDIVRQTIDRENDRGNDDEGEYPYCFCGEGKVTTVT